MKAWVIILILLQSAFFGVFAFMGMVLGFYGPLLGIILMAINTIILFILYSEGTVS